MSDDIADYEIYTRRRSERALCSDFPADIAIIDGLKRWQVHLWNNGSNFTIPVLTVMNCAHHCAAHMLSGLEPYDDRDGYDFRIFKHVGQDRIIMAVVIVVLAAMLRRTEDSDRAYTCLRIITDDRPEDFYDRLSLFEHYVDTSQMVRYREKELLRDAAILLERIAQLEAEKQQQTTYIQTLEKKIDIMEKETKHIGYNVENMTINMSGGTLVQHADLVQASGEVVVEQHADIENKQPKDCQQPSFCIYLVPDKITEMGIMTPAQAEDELRAESEKDAKHFAAYLRKKEKAGTLYFHGDTKKQIHATLQAHFPNMKRYTYNNFIAYF